MIDNIESHLKEASQLTGAAWAVLAEREGGRWLVRSAFNLNKTKQSALIKFFMQESVDDWLAGAMNGGNSRSASLSDPKLDVSRIYIYPIPNSSRALLAGADQQSANSQRAWRLIAELLQPSQPESSAANILPSLQVELPFDMPRALERVLAGFVRVVNPQGAWIAIRRGDTLDISAQWNDPRSDKLSLSIDSNGLLRRLNRTLADVSASKGQP